MFALYVDSLQHRGGQPLLPHLRQRPCTVILVKMLDSASCNEFAVRLGFHAMFPTDAWQDTVWHSFDLRYSVQCPPSEAHL